MATRAVMLRPMEYGEILDEAFQLYKENFRLLIGITAVVYVPLGIINILIVSGMTATGSFSPTASTEPTPEQLVAILGGAAALIIVALLAIPFSLFMTGAMTKAISDRYLGRDATVGSSFSYIFGRAWPYLLTVLLVSLLQGLGYMMCVIPGVIIYFMTAFATQVAVVEGTFGIDNIRRTTYLAAGQWLRIFILGLVVLLGVGVASAIISNLISQPLMYGVGPEAGMIGSQLGSVLASIFLMPFSTIALILLYFDIRVRKEGFDVALLAQSLRRDPGQPLTASLGGVPLGLPTGPPTPPSPTIQPYSYTPPQWGSTPPSPPPPGPSPEAGPGGVAGPWVTPARPGGAPAPPPQPPTPIPPPTAENEKPAEEEG